MNTRERAEVLAEAAGPFPFLGPTTADELIQVVAAELGDGAALDRFVSRGGDLARAFARTPILHIVAGNTPAAGLQTAIRGLLLGAHNLVKLPSEGLPELEEFVGLLPNDLAARIKLRPELPPKWMDGAEAVVVFGSDATIAEVHRRVRADQVFVPHGHRVSFGVIFEDGEFKSAEGAARDASLFDQLGCLSPHVFYVTDDPRGYAARLAECMQKFDADHPRLAASAVMANAIRSLREETAFRAASGEDCAVWVSPNTTAWTVVYDASTGFPQSPLNRTIFVKPRPDSFQEELINVRHHLSCVGIYPATAENAARLADCGASRLCPIGRMQQPPWTWHQDGVPSLEPLVRWVGIEL